ncbi:MAG: BCD family MFS transporter [Alphaproteobacteria bacterium]|nr:BCD family MFS transporter [Alphaproteobacteria bacterium]
MTDAVHPARFLTWIGIVRLGLVQTALGAIVVLTTSTLNRVMVVELALPAALPGILVALHYAVQMLRPKFGHRSDVHGKRTPWIIGGMAVLALGGLTAALATALMAENTAAGVALAVVAFLLIGGGVGAAGTSLLALLATCTAPRRRPAAATIVWMMMIAGFVITAAISGQLLDPFSLGRLIAVAAGIAGIAFLISVVAVAGVENSTRHLDDPSDVEDVSKSEFMATLKEVWAETDSRKFTIFVFVSMLAYSTQELILEPFGGHIFGMTVGETTQLSGMQNSGVLIGMIFVAVVGSVIAKGNPRVIRGFILSGCLASAVALWMLTAAAAAPEGWPLVASVMFLGFGNGVFAVAAISAMMTLAGKGTKRREGLRMGLWGAAQAIAFGAGGFLGAASVDLVRAVADNPPLAYGLVFAVEGGIFVLAAWLARDIGRNAADAQDWASHRASDRTSKDFVPPAGQPAGGD